ncbi:hypothetical protein GCM10027271_16960 [Saccharopolyspora gloriosae]|uniref:Uncharacterized protein n=1 Tax=Saccharopolyspora gloriosae TaxID=455344 RepID=A0A840N5F7_9PSEU|nr:MULTISPECIES: hypothetical protein [Saccharopolyspora]MBB5067246.1 hypothetical protein [Saccharopolyspora gloriosae]MCX2732066.1 hypothetical protein [Saccharopolyspora sp. NFXS83]
MVGALIVLVVVGGISVSLVSYFRLQAHRVDAVANAHYRTFVERSVAEQAGLRFRLGELSARVESVEQLLRSYE